MQGQIEKIIGEDGKTRIVFDRLRAVMTVPRYGSTEACARTSGTMAAMRIPLKWYGGAYRYEQGMQKAFEDCVDDGIEWVITLDYDSIFTVQQVEWLLSSMAEHPEADAISTLQKRRHSRRALVYLGGQGEVAIQKGLLQAKSAHFGLTLIKASLLKDLPKPWFRSIPDETGSYGLGRIDPDVYFWNQWRESGHTVFVNPHIRIGHEEEFIGYYDQNANPKLCYMDQFDKIMRGEDPGEIFEAIEGNTEYVKQDEEDAAAAAEGA